jgi:plasmid stability protein
MASITIKNMPDNIYKKLKNRAKSNNRSINGEVVNLLKKELDMDFDSQKIIEQAKLTRSWAIGPMITDNEINEFKNAGRE